MMRLSMPATGSPGERRGMKNIRVAPSQTVRANMPSRRST